MRIEKLMYHVKETEIGSEFSPDIFFTIWFLHEKKKWIKRDEKQNECQIYNKVM